MSRAVLSIGSNLGDRLAALRTVVNALEPWLVAVSSVYENPPWGPVPQPDFLNAVVIADDPLRRPADWLSTAHELEDAAGRVRTQRWGPRTLDVDVIDVAGVVSSDPVLMLPHPRADERAFVLLPWAEVEPRDDLLAKLAMLPASEREAIRLRSDMMLR